MLIFRNGQKTITLPKFEPESYIKALDTYKPTFLNLVNLDFWRSLVWTIELFVLLTFWTTVPRVVVQTANSKR